MKKGDFLTVRNPGGGSSFKVTDLSAWWGLVLGFIVLGAASALAAPFAGKVSAFASRVSSRVPGGVATAPAGPSDGFIDYK